MVFKLLILNLFFVWAFASIYKEFSDDLQYYVYPSRILESDDHITLETHDGIDFNRCIASCERFDFCRAIAVNHTDTAVTCRYFDYVSFTSTAISTTAGFYYITKQVKTKCTFNCEKNVCGTCKCDDFCSRNNNERGGRHYLCDCSQVIEAEASCNDVTTTRGEDFIAGLYTINPDSSGAMTVYCVKLDKVHYGIDLQCEFISGRYSATNVANGRTVYGFYSEDDCKKKAFENCQRRTYNVWTWNTGGSCEAVKSGWSKKWGRTSWHACEITFKEQNSTALNPPLGVILMLSKDGNSHSNVWDRTFADYEVGFRDHQNEWIGLEKLAKISGAFHMDIRVDVIDSAVSETFTTFYRDAVITNVGSVYTLTYDNFDAAGVGTMYYYHLPQIDSGAQFGTCSDNAEWFCRTSGYNNYNPTAKDNFGFGDYKTISSISFFIITKTKK